MPIYSPTGFLDITNATLRTSNTECQNLQIGSGNVYVTTDLTSNLVLNLENITNLGNSTSNTMHFTNATTGLIADSNIVVTGNVTAGSFLGDGSGLTSIPPSAITGTLSQWSDGANGDVYIASNVGIGNVHTLTSNTLQVGANLYVRDADANVLTVTGNVAADYFEGDGSKLTGISSTLQAITDSGNVTSNTVQFTNATTGFVTTSNIEVGGALKINTITAAAYHSLQAVTNVGNVTSNTVQFSNATTGLVTTGNVEVGRDLSVTGNLSVLGTRTIVDTDTLRVKDPIIELGKDNPGTGDLGLVMTRPSGSSNVAMVFDESTDTLEIGYTQSNASDTDITMRTAATEPLDVNVNGNVEVGGELSLARLVDVGTNSRTRIGLGSGGGTTINETNQIAIGEEAGYNDQGQDAIAIGRQSGWSSQSSNTVAMGTFAGQTNQGISAIAVGTSAGQTDQSLQAVAIGNESGNTSQGIQAVAVGNQAGNTSQGNYAVAVGHLVGQTSQGNFATAVGRGAGQTSQESNATAVGNQAGQTSQGPGAIAVGFRAGRDNQGSAAVAVGRQAGETSQGVDAVAVGRQAGKTSQGNNTVAVGYQAGETGQGAQATAVGYTAGQSNQEVNAVAVGYLAGSSGQTYGAVAIGTAAGDTTQGNSAVAVGYLAGRDNQGSAAVAVGTSAGLTRQGDDAIAIGERAGETDQGANSIILNATGVALNSTTASSFHVKPVRGGNFAASALAYTSTGEIVEETNMHFDTSGNVGIGTTNPGVKLNILGGSTTGTRDSTLIVRGDGSDIVPLINASSGGQTVKTIAGIELTSMDTPLSGHGRHSYIESVSAGSTYNTDIEFRARGGGGYTYSKGSSPAQKQARIAHNGYIYARVGTSATGADYAELFEWNDGNPENEDRTGMTVKLMEGGKIGIADANTPPNDIIGVISVIYGFLGNNHWDEWVGKYLKDGLGRTVTETVDMVTWRDEDDKEHTFTIDTIPDGTEVPETASYYQDTGVPKINPKYDKTLEYTERGKRKEWGAVGLVGRLRVMKAYPKHSRWIKLQDIDDEVEEYLAI